MLTTAIEFQPVMLGIVLSLGTNWLEADDATPEKMLTIAPSTTFRDYDQVTDPDALARCVLETATPPFSGYVLRAPDGKLLRLFVDTNRDGRMDRWSYYKDGFEVYRELSFNANRRVDQCRWLNQAGTRIGEVQDDRIVSWVKISAPEATQVFVEALNEEDDDLLETIMATPEELEELGLPDSEVRRADERLNTLAKTADRLRDQLTGWDESTVWLRFDAARPHVIPADPGLSIDRDLTLFENGLVFVGDLEDPTRAAKMAYLQVPELVQIGETWKFVGWPQVIDPNNTEPMTLPASGIRFALFRGRDGSPGGISPEFDRALERLATYDEENDARRISGDPKQQAEYFLNRITPLDGVIASTNDASQRLTYQKQKADALVQAYQNGIAKALDRLEPLIEQGGPLASYAEYRRILAQFIVRNSRPKADFVKVQGQLVDDLTAYLEKYPKGDEAAEALLQLASINEFNADEDAALTYYRRLADQFPSTSYGQKAAGALRRFDLVGQTINLVGPIRNGRTIDVAADFQGQTVAVVFWASWSRPIREDFPLIEKLRKTYENRRFALLGVNLDSRIEDLNRFLDESSLNWPQIYQPGGMESPLANQFGIISLPTILVVGPDGKVIARDIRTAEELEAVLTDQFSDTDGS